ncbi:T9SS C-terminal target domain-containing protein [Lutibacter sp. HS1-25]|uniref:T9SS type A sorting domain-containing protein n=1 Tax=Lutibacter sp. HS1-25 TaxID=2485000 RepID=UPI001012E898|nr:T9SS type A sorting domain-containing protein [Lutibacter sp. HS1-25]RXP53810.1 T9SS C-terminal target domain-containing protein [Lutibacter sp. HS1-25]
MGYVKYVFKRVLFIIFFINVVLTYGQITIASQNFDNPKSGLGYSVSNSNIKVSNITSESSPNSLMFEGKMSYNYVTFNEVDISSYSNVTVTLSFASIKVKSGENLYLEVIYDGGNRSWLDLIAGNNNNQDVNWGTPDGDGSTVNSNPYTLKVPNDVNKIQVRVIVSNLNNNRYFFIDNLLIEGDPYCTPSDINDYNTFFISDVSLGSLHNPTSGTTGSYTNFSEDFLPVDVNVGGSLNGTISVNLDGHNNDVNHLVVWIDFNQNFVFDEFDEKYVYEIIDPKVPDIIKTVKVPVSIPIPASALIGNTRMRIGLVDFKNGKPYNACDFNYRSGEVEDYTINITNGCSINTWTGVVSADWNTDANWSCGGVPTITTNVLIPAGVTNYPEIASTDAGGLANDIEIENGATLTVFDNSIEIDGTLLLNGFMHLDGEGQLIQNRESILDASSLGGITQSQQGTANLYSYNYWGSPVGTTKLSTNASVSDYSYSLSDILYSDLTTKVTFLGGNNYNGSVGPPIVISDYWIWKFANKPAGVYSEWQHVRSKGEIKAGEGFTMKGTTTGDVSTIQNYVFRGLPNNGAVSLTVSGGNEYLVANPYPSAIDGYQFINDNKPTNPEGSLLTGTLYFWQQFKGTSHNLADYEGGYATLTLAGGLPAAVASIGDLPDDLSELKTPGQYIPVAQGFFTSSDTDGGKIKFNNGQRYFVPQSSESSIFIESKNSKSKTSSVAKAQKDVRPKFRLGFKAPQIKHRQLLLTIDENTTDAVDWGYDGEMNGMLVDDMYWALDNKKYVIQGLPDANIDREIPLGIKMSKTGLATIQIDALENVDESVELFIKDALVGKTYKINNQPFEIELAAGTYTDRFSLVFAPQETLDLEDEILKNGVLVFMNNTAGEIQIKNTIQAELLSVNLYNSLGQLQNTWDKNLQGQNLNLPVSNVAAGMYLVQIKAATGIIAKKVIIE